MNALLDKELRRFEKKNNKPTTNQYVNSNTGIIAQVNPITCCLALYNIISEKKVEINFVHKAICFWKIKFKE